MRTLRWLAFWVIVAGTGLVVWASCQALIER